MDFKNILVGGDPELLLSTDRKIDNIFYGSGKMIPALGLFGGTKENPVPIPGLPKGYKMQEDNVALEFNFPPANDGKDFSDRVTLAVSTLIKISNAKGYYVTRKSSAIFDEDVMTDERLKVFGCDPDFNAWTLEENSKPEPPYPNFRCAGGHVHISWEAEEDPSRDILKGINLMRAMDVFAGLSSIEEDKAGVTRRQFYGKAGCYRQVKPNWFEYRVLSNFWVFNPYLSNSIFTKVIESAYLLKSKDGVDFLNDNGEKIQALINSPNGNHLEFNEVKALEKEAFNISHKNMEMDGPITTVLREVKSIGW